MPTKIRGRFLFKIVNQEVVKNSKYWNSKIKIKHLVKSYSFEIEIIEKSLDRNNLHFAVRK